MKLHHLTLLLLAACAAPSPEPLPSPQPVPVPSTPEVKAELALRPGRLQFGEAAIGAEVIRQVVIENSGNRRATLTSAQVQGDGFTLLTALPLDVPAKGSVTLAVQARALSGAEQSGTLTLRTDVDVTLSLPLLLNRVAPCLSSSASRLDFPTIEAACHTPGQTVTLTNGCPHPVRLAPPQVPTGFGLVSTAGLGLLVPGASQQVSVVFAPTSSGAAQGTLTLRADVLDGTETLQLSLAGIATPPAELEERTIIPGPDMRLDVLLVIDDSPRMLPSAERVAENLGWFAQYLRVSGYETRVAVMSTSTAPGVVGRLRRTSTGGSWLDNPTKEELQALTAVRGEGTDRSSCLEALVAAAASPVRDAPGELGSMLRPNVGLNVVCITNGRDELQAAPMQAFTTLAAALPKKRMVSVVARFVDAPGCTGTVDHGPLRAFAQALAPGEIIEEFCTPDWAITLERIGVTAFGWYTSVPVFGEPNFSRGPLRVFLGQQEIPQEHPQDRTPIWSWSPELHAVLFEPLYMPAPGTPVTVRYTPDCPR